MALGDSYATLAELKTRLRIADNDDNDALTSALAVASRGVEACCNRQFNDAGSATARVFKPTAPTWSTVDDFSTSTGLVVAVDVGDDGTYETTWASTDYELWPLNGITGGQTGWPYSKIRVVGAGRYFPRYPRRAVLQVTARWGWTAVPAPVKEAALILAEDLFKLRDTPFGVGGYGEYGRVRARENPNVWLRVSPYVRDAVLVA